MLRVISAGIIANGDPINMRGSGTAGKELIFLRSCKNNVSKMSGKHYSHLMCLK